MKSAVRRLLAALLVMAACTAMAACGQSEGTGVGKDGQLTTTMQSLAKSSISGAVPDLMETRGIDKENGIDITLRADAVSSDISMAALLSRKADFATVATQSAFEAANKGAEIVIVAPVYEGAGVLLLSTDAAERVNVSDDAAPAEKLRALKGMRIGTTSEGSGTYKGLIRYLRAAGIDPQEDVEVVPIADPTAMTAALKQGTVDAVLGQVNALVASIVEGDAKYWLVETNGDMESLRGRDDMAGVVVTRQDVLSSHPEVVKAVFDSLQDSAQAIADDPDESARLLQEHWMTEMPAPVFEEMWRTSSAVFPTDGKLTRAAYENVIGVVGADPKKLTYEDLVYEAARD